MGFFKDLFSRGSRVVKGQVNKGMDVLEDATFESTLKQSVKDMKQELNKVIRSSADAMSNYNRLEAEYNKYQQQAQEWEERAMRALEAGKEDLAKKALSKRQEADKQVETLKPGVEQAQQTADMLKKQVAELKRKIEEAERMAGTLIARKNAANAQKKVSQALAGVGESNNAFAAIRSMEESVERDEAAARAYETLAVDEDSDLAKEFEELDTASVDDELEALKKKMGK
ncbi:MAG: PspA/IM30 family protein [Planctomycetota bacterium]|jgi:phage shock protein A